jgi:serine/threonine-protein kinase
VQVVESHQRPRFFLLSRNAGSPFNASLPRLTASDAPAETHCLSSFLGRNTGGAGWELISKQRPPSPLSVGLCRLFEISIWENIVQLLVKWEEAVPPKISMDKDTIALLGVEAVHMTFAGGQKYVFICTCKGVKCAVKMFRYGFGVREKRELKFYRDNAHNTGIPNIIDVIDHKGETIVVEEFIEGQSLGDVAVKYTENYDKISNLLHCIIDIMKPIWEAKLVHRDLKPANIIIKPDESPVILDFGIFKDPEQSTITDTGFQPHSWDFAAPEQLFGKKEHISYRTDFFSLGVIAYYLYYQMRPFGNSKDGVIATFQAVPLSYASDSACKLNKLFKSVFSINPSERPRNVDFLKEAI